MGWIIFAIIVLLLLAPLFVPITLRAKVDRERREWSVYVGPLQLLPDLATNLERYKNVLQKISRPFVWIFKGIAAILRFLFLALKTVVRGLTWPWRAVKERKKQKAQKAKHTAPETLSKQPPSSAEPAKETEQISQLQPEKVPDPSFVVVAQENEPATPGQLPETSKQTSSETSSDTLPKPEKTPSPFDDLDDFFGDESTTPNDKRKDQKEEDSSGPSFKEKASEAFSSTSSTINKLKESLDKARALYHEYGKLGKKLLSAAIKLALETLKTLQFKVFDARLAAGGDPATMGMLLGWHEAILGALEPRLRRHLIFEPDFENHEFSVDGSLNVVLVVWPYRFVPPILRFGTRIPWIEVIRQIRRYMKKDRG